MRMEMSKTMDAKPKRKDVEEDSYALCVRNEEHSIWKYEKSQFQSTPEWREVPNEYQEIPQVDLEGVDNINIENGERVWLYADEIDPEQNTVRNQDETVDAEQDNTGKYVIEFSDGKKVAGNAQADAMANAVDHLVNEYSLLDEIDLPYMSGYKNSLINNRDAHPDGREMSQSRKLSSGDYLEISVGREQKKEYLSDLCAECDEIDLVFLEGWEDP